MSTIKDNNLRTLFYKKIEEQLKKAKHDPKADLENIKCPIQLGHTNSEACHNKTTTPLDEREDDIFDIGYKP